MKKFKILALMLVIAMVPLSMFACTKKETITCQFEVLDENKEVIYGPYNISIEGTEKNWPTALQVAQKAFMEYDIPFELTADGNSIGSINGIAGEESMDEEYGYYSYWNLLVDGKESTDGRQSLTKVYSGEKLQLVFTSDKTAREDNVTTPVTEADD